MAREVVVAWLCVVGCSTHATLHDCSSPNTTPRAIERVAALYMMQASWAAEEETRKGSHVRVVGERLAILRR